MAVNPNRLDFIVLLLVHSLLPPHQLPDALDCSFGEARSAAFRIVDIDCAALRFRLVTAQ